MRKQPTLEQKEAARQRREKFRGLVKQIAAMSESQRAEFASRLPVVATCEGHGLSVPNTMLCVMQKPDVSLVGGFKQWKRQGRAVRKGEHGLSIWCPVFPGADVGDTPQPGEIDGDSRGDDKPRFILGTVFDIGQTCELGEGLESEVN